MKTLFDLLSDAVDKFRAQPVAPQIQARYVAGGRALINQDYVVYKIDRRLGEVMCVLVVYRPRMPDDDREDRKFMNEEILRYAGRACGKCGHVFEKSWDGNEE
jgi:hypothetical protein